MENPKPIKFFTPGWGGRLAQTILVLVSTNWVLVVSAVVAYLSWAFATAQTFVKNQDVQIVAGVFLFFLWTLIGFTVLRDRKKPRTITPHHDYRYGLTFEGIVPFFPIPKKDTDAALSFGISVRNFSSGPLKYTIEVFDVIVDDRVLPKMKKGTLTSIMSRGAGRMSRNQAFSKEKIKDFYGKDVKGTLELAIVYGHPERPPERRLKMTFELTIGMREGELPVYADNIVSESDEPIV